MTLSTIIIDDSPEARIQLRHFCQKNPHVKLVAECASAEEGLELLKKQVVDLVLLDVEMPGLSGIEFLQQASVLPMIIFITSKEKYAFNAFEFEAVDYLKKPFNFSRFEKAITKAVKIQQPENQANQSIGTNTLPSSIFIKEKGRHIRLNSNEILYFENFSDYVRIHTANKQHLIYSTLKNIAAKLPPKKFLRIHRSYIVNLDKIVDIEENTLVIDRTVIPIGKAHKSKLMKSLKLI